MKTRTTLVIGATGKTGRRVAEGLTAHGVPVRAGSRFGAPPFDWERPETWVPAVRGVSQAYVTYYPDLAFPGAAEKVGAFANLAVDYGVRRLLLLSGRNEEGARRGEQAVKESGAEWTLIRSSFFAQNFSESFWRESILEGVLAVPAGDVGEPFIDIDDIAEIAIAALTTDKHVGEMYEVTGPRLLTFADAAAQISRAAGRDVRYIPLSPAEFASTLENEGVPVDFARDLTGLFSELFDGRGAYLTNGVRRALGREPKDFADFARDAASGGAWRDDYTRFAGRS